MLSKDKVKMVKHNNKQDKVQDKPTSWLVEADPKSAPANLHLEMEIDLEPNY